MHKINNWIWEDKKITESTNDDGIALSTNFQSEYFIISAEQQTKGRGRRGRNWVSEKGNLFFSQGMPIDMKNLGQLITISTYSLYQTIAELLPVNHTVQIKWPNDILIDGKKVSGMLLEKGENGYLIIGIGVNIKVAPQSSEILYPATDLAANGINIDRLSFLKSYIDKFDAYYQQWQKAGFNSLKQNWLNAVKGLGEEIYVHTDTEVLQGIFKGIGDRGELLLFQANKIKKIYAGDVFYIKEKE